MVAKGNIEDYNSTSKEILKVCVEENVKVIVAVGFPNAEGIKQLKELGFTVIFRQGDPTIEGAKIAESAGANIIVAAGFESGGITSSSKIETKTIVQLMVDALDELVK